MAIIHIIERIEEEDLINTGIIDSNNIMNICGSFNASKEDRAVHDSISIIMKSGEEHYFGKNVTLYRISDPESNFFKTAKNPKEFEKIYLECMDHKFSEEKSDA